MELKYDGGAYCGWQRQKSVATVQQTIEDALSTILREDIEIVGAGRTDTGVHAAYYVAHFDSSADFEPSQLLYKLNTLLPHDIAVDSITSVAAEAHARFDAIQREYTYFITTQKNPFRRSSAWYFRGMLDIEAMNDAAARLLKYEDFTSFAKLNSNNKTNICHISHAEWVVEKEGVLRFTLRADRFLRNMVRSIVGTLVDVGRGRLTPTDFEEIIAAQDLSRSSGSAPSEGLFLSNIVYPETTFIKHI